MGFSFMLGTSVVGMAPPTSAPVLPSLYWGQVATNCNILTTRSSSNKQFQSRSHHVARDTITSLKIQMSNWYWLKASTKAETNPVASITYKASIEYPAGTFTQVLFGGSASGVCGIGADLLSDEVTVSIPNGAHFWVRIFGVSASELLYNNGVSPDATQCDPANGEALTFAASGIVDQTMSGTVVATDPAGGVLQTIVRPTAIIAQTRKPSVLLVGDSRTWSSHDTHDATGDLGELARSIGASLGYINVACPSDTPALYNAGGTKRSALQTHCSHVLVNFGINGLNAIVENKSAATVLTEIQTLLAFFSTKRRYITTITPLSTSGTSWSTLAGQTVNGNAVEIAAFNDAIRAGISNVLGFFEVADQIESSRNSSKYKVDGTNNKYTKDGIHGSPFACQAILLSGVVNPNTLNRTGL